MGTWGTGLYQDDTTCDIKDDYITYLKIGMTNEEATRRIIEENDWCFEYEDEGALLWFALADTQWKYGRLLDEVKEKAIECIDSGIDLEKWKEDDEKLYQKRKKVLEALRERLNSQQSQKKKIEKFKSYSCPWKIGDVYAFKVNEDNKEKYMAFINVELQKCYPDNLCPVIYVYNGLFNKVPKMEELKNIKYLPQFFVPEAYKGYEKVLYKSIIYIENKTKKYINDYIYIGNNKNYKQPKNEDKNREKHICLVKNFKNEQIFSYNKWQKIEY